MVTMMRAVRVPADDSQPMVECHSSRSGLREELDADLIERVRIGDWSDPAWPLILKDGYRDEHRVIMVVDEDGVRKQLPVNRRASWLYGSFAHHGGWVHGDALLLGEDFVYDDVDPGIGFVDLPDQFDRKFFEALLDRNRSAWEERTE